MNRRKLMSKTIDAALAVSFLSFVPGCENKPKEVPYSDLGYENEKLTFNGAPFTGVSPDIDKKTGKVRVRWELKEGVPHGVVKEWAPNGQMIVETHYHEGKRHGLNRYWTPEGQLTKEQVYEHGTSVSVKEYPAKK